MLLRLIITVAVLLLAVPRVQSSDAAMIAADRAQYIAAGRADRIPYLYYVTTEPIAADNRNACEVALKLVIPSMAPRQVNLAHCSPVQVSPTLWRLDTIDLGWDFAAWSRVVAKNPYHVGPNYAVMRADWLLLQLTDAHDSPAYYELVFGGKAPKTRDEALAFLGVNQAVNLQFGLIEGRSGVSVAGTRLIRNLAGERLYAWGTADTLELTADRDALEQPEGDSRHDGEEWIIGLPKQGFDTASDAFIRGSLQVYFLANGAGAIVDRAPVDLVVDHTGFRGLREIRTAGSCIQCHTSGLNHFTRNEFRALIQSGVDVWAYYADQQQLEAFHFADIDKELRRNNEDYAAIVKLACGCPPEDAALAFQVATGLYDEPLDLAACARELYVTAEALKLALAYASSKGYRLGARLSSLAHGGKVPRAAWEQQYLAVQSICAQWDSVQ